MVKRKWINGWERMAYVTLEHVVGKRTIVEISCELRMKPNKVENIVRSTLGITGQIKEKNPDVIAHKMRRMVYGSTDAERDVDHIETFTRRELLFRGKYRYTPPEV